IKTGKDLIEIEGTTKSLISTLKVPPMTPFDQNNRLESVYVHDTQGKSEIRQFTKSRRLKLTLKSQANNIQIETYNDHRIAMCFGILLDILPLEIVNPTCVSKSYTTFWKDLKKLDNS
ncbi:MAG: hypothetical protein Q7J22_01230, partial [Candidatus Wolfebacteria bacterium]|nr:hypothetical protein [Candidatus Wolfebacteria bacterium]